MKGKRKRKARQGKKGLEMPFSNVPAMFLDMVYGFGMDVFKEMVETEIAGLCGARYRHSPTRGYVRWGKSRSAAVVGGRRVSLEHGRVRDLRKKRERRLKTVSLALDMEPLLEMAVRQMGLGVSTRNYHRSLEGHFAGQRGMSKSAVSRRFVARTAAQLKDWLSRPLGEFTPILLIDGIHFRGTVVVVVLGITLSGKKLILGAWEGSTENARVCTDLLQNLIQRGLDPESVGLLVVDGGKGLLKAIGDVFGKDTLVQRCQVHKKRNVLDYLPQQLKQPTLDTMNEAYRAPDYETAKRLLVNLANRLRKDHPSAAASLEEGLEETLTLHRIECPAALRKVLASTNAIENVMGTIRRVTKRVRRWRNSGMVMRWVCTGLIQAESGFRRISGYTQMKFLLEKIKAEKERNKAA